MRKKPYDSKEKWFWIFCLIGSFAILSSTMSKNPVLNPFAKSLETPDPFMGFVASASTIPGILISLPAGTLSDILGRRKMLVVSSIIFASAPFLYLLINAWWQLILVRFYHGFATAIFVPVANASIAEVFPKRRAEKISTFSTATIIGRTAAPFLGGYILSVTTYNFKSLYLAVGIAGVTTFILTFSLFKEGKTAENVSTKKGKELNSAQSVISGWSKVVRNRGVLVISFIESVQYYGYGTIEYFLVGYLNEIVKLDAFLIGIISGGLLVVSFAKPFLGRLSDRIGRKIPIFWGCIMAGIPLLGIPLTKDFVFLLLFAVLYGIGFALVTSSTPAFASELSPPKLVGTTMGFLGTIMDVGQTLGPIISGLILANFGYVGLFYSLTTLYLASSIIFASLITKRE